LRTAAALERTEVAVILFDVTEPISEGDIRIVDLALESGRALVLAFNKWDQLDEEIAASFETSKDLETSR
jgi:GTP-binding protein